MNKINIHSDLEKLDATKDDDIDYSDVSELDDAILDSVKMKFSPGKKQIALRVDTDVLEWMKAQGKGYQSRINAVLRAYYEDLYDFSSAGSCNWLSRRLKPCVGKLACTVLGRAAAGDSRCLSDTTGL